MNLSVAKRHPKRTAWAIGAALLLYALWPLTYSADAIDARLVDAETNEPIVGAIIVAHWELVGGLEGGSVQGQMMVMEAETNAEGQFHFPAWGPKPIPLWLQLGRLGSRDPGLIFFKPGYEIGEELNDKTTTQWAKKGPARCVSQWNGKTIMLKRMDDRSTVYRNRLTWLNLRLGEIAISNPDPCAWRRVPRMILAIRNEDLRIGKDRVFAGNTYDGLLSNDAPMVEIGCGSPRAFFAGNAR